MGYRVTTSKSPKTAIFVPRLCTRGRRIRGKCRASRGVRTIVLALSRNSRCLGDRTMRGSYLFFSTPFMLNCVTSRKSGSTISMAALVMSCILVDHAHSRRITIHGGYLQQLAFDAALLGSGGSDNVVTRLDDALTALAASPTTGARKAQVVESAILADSTPNRSRLCWVCATKR